MKFVWFVANLFYLIILSKEKCRNIRPHSLLNAQITVPRRSCLICGCKEGTVIKITCNEWYYFENQDYADGQALICYRNQWINKRHVAESPAKCIRGCKVLNDNDMKNATYSYAPSKNQYRNGDKIYWPSGTRIRTKCFGFAFPPWRQKNEDDFTCLGGNIGWKRAIGSVLKQGGDDGRPGLCNPLCLALDPINDFAAFTIVENQPSEDAIVTMNGKKYIYDGYIYSFRCEKGTMYDKNGPHHAKQRQQLVCIGGEAGYQDLATGAKNARPVECVKSGCTSFMKKIDKNSVVTNVDKKCRSLNSNSIAKGCHATIVCGEFHYFDNKDYGNGMKLICTDNGWVDQSGKPYDKDKPVKCQKGCRALTEDDMKNATYEGDEAPTNENLIHKNGDKTYWSNGVKVTTKCKKGFVRLDPSERDEPNSFICIGGSDGWRNSKTGKNDVHPASCEPVCSQITKLPQGTRIKREPKDTVIFDGIEYIYPQAMYVYECEDGYEYPENSPYARNKQQTIFCAGGLAGYKDMDSGELNAEPFPCQVKGAKGCDPITTMTTPNAFINENKCELEKGKVPKGCQVTIECKEGYHLFDENNKPIIAKQQILLCEAGKNGWVDKNNKKKNATTMKCLPVCKLPKELKNAIIVAKPDQSDLVGDGTLVREGGQMIIKCKATYVMPTESEREKVEVALECIGGPSKWKNKVTGMSGEEPGKCLGTCIAITDPPKGVAIIMSPSAFYHEGKMVIIENQQYIFKCNKGYQYPANKAHSKQGKQIIECKNGKDGFYDPDSQQINAKPEKCVRGETPGCKKLDPKSPPPNMKITSHKGCSLDHGKTVVGCKLVLECEEDYFTVDDTYIITGKQELECVDDGTKSDWQNKEKNRVMDFMKCHPGCEVRPMPNTKVIQAPKPIIVGGKQFYKSGAKMIIQCKEGTSPPNADINAPLKPREYECKGGKENWLEKETMVNEKWPGESCLGYCDAINRAEGFRFLQQPALYEMNEKKIVRENAKYIIECKKGYHYSKESAIEKDGKQILKCSNDGKYKDLTRNKIVNEPEKCKKDIGPGCKDIVQENWATIRKQCGKGDEQIDSNHCSLIIRCKEGFFPEDKAYHKDGFQKIHCKDGNDWMDQNNKIIKDSLKCAPGCIQPSSSNSPIIIKRNSSNIVNINKDIYILPSGKIEVICKDGYVWTATNKRQGEIIECVGGDRKWKNDEDVKIDVIDEACTGICPIEMKQIPQNVFLAKNATFHELKGEMYVLDKTAFEFQCKTGYVYLSNPYKNTKRQTIRCNGDTKKYFDDDTKQYDFKLENCERPPNANECKEIKQDADSTDIKIKNCKKDGEFYPTGCIIKVQCAEGYYPKDELYQKSVSQELRCGPSGSGWFDQYNRPIKERLYCIKGCISRDVKESLISSANTTINTEITIYKFTDGTSVKCTSKEKKVDINVNLLRDSNKINKFYCSGDKKNDKNISSNIEFDNKCFNSCIAIENIPRSVSVFKFPNIFEHDGKRYAQNMKPYVFKCNDGYAYPKETIHNRKARQALSCNSETHFYDDIDTGEKNVGVKACEKLNGCLMIKQDPQVEISLKNCIQSNELYIAGCVITMTCPKTPQHYPSDNKYWQDGMQKLTCSADDDSGWRDQYGNIIDKPFKCTQGCIPRPTSPPSTSTNTSMWNLKITIKGKVITCKAGSESKMMNKMEEIAKLDHKFFCEPKVGSSDGFRNRAIVPDTCINACFAITDIPDTVFMEKKPNRLFDFKGIKDMIVAFDEIYTFRCKDSNGYFMTDGKPKQRKLKCDGETGAYTNVDTGEKDVQLVGCTSNIHSGTATANPAFEKVVYEHNGAAPVNPGLGKVVYVHNGTAPVNPGLGKVVYVHNGTAPVNPGLGKVVYVHNGTAPVNPAFGKVVYMNFQPSTMSISSK